MKYTLDLKDAIRCTITEQTLYRVVRPDGVKGGYIASEANLSQDGLAWVADGATVAGFAQVSGNARVTGHAKLVDRAKVYGDALVTGMTVIAGQAKVYESATVSGKAHVEDSAKVHGQAKVSGRATVGGQAELEGDSQVAASEDYIHFIAPGVLWATTITSDRIVCGCLAKPYAEWDAAGAAQFTEHKVDDKYFAVCEALIRAARAYLKAHNASIT